MANLNFNNLNNKSIEVLKLLEVLPELEMGYDLLSKIGEGSFSKVYKATKKNPNTSDEYALKYITTSTDPKRIAAELKFMIKLGGRNNVMGLCNCELIRGNVILVMPYFQHNSFYDYVELLNYKEIRDYMSNLFIALEWIHENGVIHRDVKPSNFLYCRATEQYALVDFGLAQSHQSNKQVSATSTIHVSKMIKPSIKKNNLKIESVDSVKTSQLESSKSCKRNLDQALESAELTIQAKKPCIEVEQFTNSPKIKVLQPLGTSNRINITLLPPGSDAIKKPTAVLHKKILFKENAKGNNSSTFKVPETTSTVPPQLSTGSVVNPASSSISGAPRSCIRSSSSCQCFGKKTVCNMCLSKLQEYAPRAGTPGFRPPEVLIKYPNQSTAVDMWAAGVIFLSLLSRRYPFFRNSDDMTALVEIMCILGLNRVKKAALRMGKVITIQAEYPAKDLHMLCESLRGNLVTKNTAHFKKETIPSSAINLLYRLLDPDPANRITASGALKHPFISKTIIKSKTQTL